MGKVMDRDAWSHAQKARPDAKLPVDMEAYKAKLDKQNVQHQQYAKLQAQVFAKFPWDRCIANSANDRFVLQTRWQQMEIGLACHALNYDPVVVWDYWIDHHATDAQKMNL